MLDTKKIIYIIFFVIITLSSFGCYNENSNLNNNTNGTKYSIFFVSNDVIVKEVKTYGNEYIPLPQELENKDYVFLGWYLDDDTIFDENYLLNKSLTKNIIVKAKWGKSQYNIIYVLDDDVKNNNPNTYNYLDGDIVLNNPEKFGYEFKGWYTDLSLNDESKIDKIITSKKKEYTLYPKWEKIKYRLEYYIDDKIVSTDDLYYNDKINLYIIDEIQWFYYDNGVLKLFDFEYMPSFNMKLYGYKPKVYEVSFDSNGGEIVNSIKYTEGEKIYLPSINYINYNYYFDGWYYNDKLVSLGNESVKINESKDITLIAKWKEVKHIDYESLTNFSISGEDNNIVMLDFTKCDTTIKNGIIVKDTIQTLILKGKTGLTYFNFSMVISGRDSDIKIVLDNFNYTAYNKVALSCKAVQSKYKVILEINGISGIKSFDESAGVDGTGYNQLADTNDARSGKNGSVGKSGSTTIEANSLVIYVKKDSVLNVYGSNGGKGGNGGNGEGSNGPGKKTAGSGGAGGNGGNGGNGIDIYNYLELDILGLLNVFGGTGGNGGNGGNGGHATVNYSTDNPDNGGNGGKGGNGGNGGYAICYKKIGSLIISRDNGITLTSGNGGKGGNGGNGGNTVSTLFYDAGKIGNGGSYGFGGNGGVVINDANINSSVDYELLIIKKGTSQVNGHSGKKGSKS